MRTKSFFNHVKILRGTCNYLKSSTSTYLYLAISKSPDSVPALSCPFRMRDDASSRRERENRRKWVGVEVVINNNHAPHVTQHAVVWFKRIPSRVY